MIDPSNNDPFNLGDLAEDIDRRVFALIIGDFEQLVPMDALARLKKAMLQEVGTLMVELLNDLKYLKQRYKITDLLGEEQRLPTVAQLVDQLPQAYGEPLPTGDAETDAKRREEWAVAQLNWVLHSLLAVYGSLVHQLTPDTPITVEVAVSTEAGDKELSIARPQQIDWAADTWHLVKRLTYEYLEQRAEVVRAYGDAAPQVSITIEDERIRVLDDIRRAFWRNRTYAPLLLLQALREGLLHAIQLNAATAPLDLRRLATNQLPFLAERAGVPLPYPAKALSQVARQLEACQAYCAIWRVSLLYPTYRIVEEVVEHLLGLPLDPDVPQRAAQVLAEATAEQNEQSAQAED